MLVARYRKPAISYVEIGEGGVADAAAQLEPELYQRTSSVIEEVCSCGPDMRAGNQENCGHYRKRVGRAFPRSTHLAQYTAPSFAPARRKRCGSTASPSMRVSDRKSDV